MTKESGFVWKYALSTIALVAFASVWSLALKDRAPHRLGEFIPAVVLAASAFSTATDLKFGKIYNSITLPCFAIVLAALLLARFAGLDWLGGPELVSGLAGAAICFTLLAIPYVAGAGAAGDVKLGVCVGLGLGLQDGLSALAVGFATTFVVALGILAFRRVTGRVEKTGESAASRARKIAAPMAPGFFLGSAVALSGACRIWFAY